MPWDVKPDEPRCPPAKPFGVVKRDDDDLEGCHATRDGANSQLAALHAAERKGQGVEMDTQKQEPVNEHEEVSEKMEHVLLVGGPTTFAELQAARDAHEMGEAMQGLTADFKMLTGNIMSSPDIEDKAAAVQALAGEFATLLESPEDAEDKTVVHIGPVTIADGVDVDTFASRVKAAVSGAIGRVVKQEKPMKTDIQSSAKEPTGGFLSYKEQDTGRYRWVAAYSNKFRDRDRPPEILSEDAHREFARAVKAGDWAHPELWLAHVRGSRCGESDYIAYDDSGFQVATGYWDTGKEWVAEMFATTDKQIGVSHGMPIAEIVRDETDPTIITRYRTREISPLLLSTAANELTGFRVLKEVGGETMPLQDEDRAKLSELIGDDGAQRLEAENAAQAAKAQDEGLEFKEADSDNATDTEEQVEQGAADSPSVEDIAATIAATINPLVERLNEQDKALGEVIEAVKMIHGTVEKMRQPDEERIAELAELTPAASLKQAVARSIIGHPDAKVDGRTKLAKDKPPETPAPLDSATGVQFLDTMLRGDGWRAGFGIAEE